MSMYKLLMTNSAPTRFKNNDYKSNARFKKKNTQMHLNNIMLFLLVLKLDKKKVMLFM